MHAKKKFLGESQGQQNSKIPGPATTPPSAWPSNSDNKGVSHVKKGSTPLRATSLKMYISL